MKNDLLLWLDVETTGLDPKVDPIIEIGMKVTDFSLNEIISRSSPVLPADWQGGSDVRLDDFSRNMHGRNHLLELLDMINGSDAYSARNVSSRLRHTVVDRALEEGARVHLAGSSVAFDRAMVNEQMPGLLRGLSHRTIDVTPLLVMSKHLDRFPPQTPTRVTDHRVDNCLKDSMNLYRHYMRLFDGGPERWGWDMVMTEPQRDALRCILDDLTEKWGGEVAENIADTAGLDLRAADRQNDGWNMSITMKIGHHLASGTLDTNGNRQVTEYELIPQDAADNSVTIQSNDHTEERSPAATDSETTTEQDADYEINIS